MDLRISLQVLAKQQAKNRAEIAQDNNRLEET